MKRVQRCAVKSCKNVRNRENGRMDLLFYNFPKGREQAWAEAIGRPELTPKFTKGYRNSNVVICSDHFGEDDFERNVANEYFNFNWRKRLRPEAVPSLMLTPLSQEQSKEKSLESDSDEASLPDEGNTFMEMEEGADSQEEIIKRLCLICSEIHCSSPTTSSSSLPEFELPGSSDFSLLNQQLLSTFILRQVLELPVWKFEDILKTAGASVQPGNWFVVCEDCSKSVVRILTNQEQIKNLQIEIDSLFEALRGKFRKSSTTSKEPFFTGSATGTLECKEKIRSFLLGTNSKPQPSRKRPASQRNNHKNLPDDDSVSEPATPDAGWDDDWSCDKIKEEDEENQDDEDWNPDSRSESECSWPLEDLDIENMEVENTIAELETVTSPKQSTSSHHRPRPKKSSKNRRKEFSCKLCLRKYLSEKVLKRHMQLHQKSKKVANGRYDCSLCGAPYDNVVSLYYHFREIHKLILNHAWEASGEPQKDYLYSSKTKKAAVAKLKTRLKGINFSARSHAKGPLTLKAKYLCEICPRKFALKGYLDKHRKYHEHTKARYNCRYDCSQCKVPFHKFTSLKNHYYAEHKLYLDQHWDKSDEPQEKFLADTIARKTKYPCTICPQAFSQQSALDRHVKLHQEAVTRYSGRFDCSQCKSPFLSRRTLNSHYRTEHNLSLDLKWETSNGWQEDFLTVVTDSDKNGDEVEISTTEKGLDSEQDKDDEENFPCSECSKSFRTSVGLNIHKHSIHKQKNAKVCEICGVEVRTNTDMKQHIFNHKIFDNSVDPSVSTTELICSICKQLFKTRRQLSNHKVNNHADELGLDVFRCDQCPRVFSRKDFWMQHYMKIHKKVGKFQCDKCDYQGINRTVLANHMSKHRETNVICQYCSATYSSDGILRSHIQRYHPEKFVSSKRKNFFVGVPVDKLSIEEGTPSWDFSFRKRMAEKPYNCKYCDAVLPHKLAFNYHLKESHKDMYKFQCDQCDKVYMSVTSLNLHLKVNHKEKSKAVKCAWCFRKVAHRLYLYSHARVCPNKPKDGDNIPKIMAIDAEDDEDSVEGRNETNPGIAMNELCF